MEKTKFTLLELTGMIGKSISESFPGKYWLVAEINEARENTNGHCYLELVEKDHENESIVARSRATIWAYTWRMLKPYFETATSQSLSKGMMVLVQVTIEFHELYGLSFNITDIDPVYTMGDLERKRTETIRQLEKEGIINMNKMLSIPDLPSRIAVISSPNAAGYEDFTHQILNNPYQYKFKMKFFPALMQGNNAASSVTGALDIIYEKENMFDLVVILRGGGSAADLNCFDTYEIASNIAQFPLPVITGIGHERDQTIAGLVAHTNLKTPTAVAEFLIGKYQKIDSELSNLGHRISLRVNGVLQENKKMLKATFQRIPFTVSNYLNHKTKNLISTGTLFSRSATGYLKNQNHRLLTSHTSFGFVIKNYLLRNKNRTEEIVTRVLPGNTINLLRKKTDKLVLLQKTVGLVDPRNVLRKGYTIVLRNGKIVKSIKNIEPGDTLDTEFHDGRINSKVLNVKAKI